MKKNKISKIERGREEKREQVRKDDKKLYCSKRKRRKRSQRKKVGKKVEEMDLRIEKRGLLCEENEGRVT